MPPATNIDEVIEFASTDIALVTYGGVDSLDVQMGLWTDGMFGASGIFPPAANGAPSAPIGQRAVSDWYGQHLIARGEIEGVGIGAAGLIGNSAVTNAVVRAAYAVKYATLNSQISVAQQTAVVALYNATWQ